MEIFIIIAATAIAIIPSIKKWDFINSLLDKMGLNHSELPKNINEELKNALLPDNVDAGGKWIGSIERFLSVIAAGTGSYEILIAWFAFKVASKWQTWSNLVKFPDSLKGISDIDLLKARRFLSSRLYDRLLIGSGINVCLGVVVGIIVRYVCYIVS